MAKYEFEGTIREVYGHHGQSQIQEDDSAMNPYVAGGTIATAIALVTAGPLGLVAAWGFLGAAQAVREAVTKKE
jgi:ABC-type phosphate transport system permease subunit